MKLKKLKSPQTSQENATNNPSAWQCISDSLRKPVSDDDIERYPLPRFSINNQRERLLSYKVLSESVRDLWSNCSFKLMGNQKVRRINFFDKKVEITNWTSCVCNRCFPQPKRKKGKVKLSESKSRLLQTTKHSTPMKPKGLNVEVPEFFPRKEDTASHRDTGQKYFPSSVATSPQASTVLYNQPQWYANIYNPAPIPPSAIHLNYNACTFGSPSFNYPQPPYNFSPEFITQMARQYCFQNHSNMQPYSQQIPPNNLVSGPQMAIGWNQPSHSLNRVSQAPNYSTRPPCMMPFQQTWAPNPCMNQYQQTPSPQQTQLAFLHQTSQQLQYLQSQTNELTNIYHQRWQNEAANQKNQPRAEPEIPPIAPRMQISESAKNRQVSPPKNIPVFQRPPESYVSAQGDDNNRRRHGTGGGGGGVVMSNLIILTKGSRCKDAKNKICPAEVQEQEDRGAKVVHDNSNDGLGSYNNTDEKFIDSLQCLSKHSLVGSIPEMVSESEDLAESEEILIDIPNGASVTVDSLAGELCQGSCNNDLDFLKESIIITSPEVTSTPKKNRRKKKYKRDRSKWLDASNSEVQNAIFRRPSGSEVSLTAASPMVQSELEGKQKRDVNHEFKVKTFYSNPSFPPIKTHQSRLIEESDISLTPLPSGCQRKLYRDVLAPSVDFSCQAVSAQAVGVSMSEDSLEVHYGELEKLAVEQYESSNDSLSRAYKNLEFEALEQYRGSSESFVKDLAGAVKSHMDVKSGCENGGSKLSVAHNISDETVLSADSTVYNRQACPEELIPSEQRRVVMLMRANSKKSYSKIANGNSSSDEEHEQKGNAMCNCHTKEKEIFVDKQQYFVQGNMGEDRNDQGKDVLIKGDSSKRIAAVEARNVKCIKNDKSSENKSNIPVQPETPNDQRTQVSPTTGNKSAREKEDLADSAEVPEAWVQKNQLQGNVVDDDIYAESIRNLFVSGTMENGFEFRPDGESVNGGKKKRRRKKKRRNGKLATTQCFQTNLNEPSDGAHVKYGCYFPEERESDRCEDLSITMADVSANDVLVCEELMRIITMGDISNKNPEISSNPTEATISGSNSVSKATVDLQEAIAEPIVFSCLEGSNKEFTRTTNKVPESKDGICLGEIIPNSDKGDNSKIITLYENKLLDSPQMECLLTQKFSTDCVFSSKEVEWSSEIQVEELEDVQLDERNDLAANGGTKRNSWTVDETILNLDLNEELADSLQSLDLQVNLIKPRHSISAPSLQNEISMESLAKPSGPLCSNSTPKMSCEASPESSTSSQSSKSSPLKDSGFCKLLGISKKVDSPRKQQPNSMSKRQAPSCLLQ
ncbi:hypothetical protein J437_LFUL001079 [Ladona fulva]|uniref:Uncharacterized protein n=1 Tax=Ladona fulva TaxID=123851 RepID=A0A8K0NW93_LADFU|nr:hypothetical protein J437_LFUL001079 [Ladona fulva]